MLKSKDQLEQHVNQFRNTLYQFEKEMDYEFSVNEWRYLLEHGLNSFLSTRKDEQQMISNVSIRTKKRPSRWKLSSGVVYAIPLPRLGGYGYAEMRVSKDENHETGKLESMDYIQYYNLRTETMLSLQELDEKHPDPCIIMDTTELPKGNGQYSENGIGKKGLSKRRYFLGVYLAWIPMKNTTILLAGYMGRDFS
ncbi:hypothetical protein QK289_08915 [Exiguobacterium antarcticum]|uniref:Transposase n=1 Tax=Exiguobacterium antarcticum TaxID=132920 RepID=A0ABT6R4D0_9BACL|nr:hypothetical protein [Exiguobacterium antarcticum]MDI3235124.1 hypothetical protein [Exiguobacterium antarcticum]